MWETGPMCYFLQKWFSPHLCSICPLSKAAFFTWTSAWLTARLGCCTRFFLSAGRWGNSRLSFCPSMMGWWAKWPTTCNWIPSIWRCVKASLRRPSSMSSVTASCSDISTSPGQGSLMMISQKWVISSYYASPTSREAYRDRRLTTNFELWVEIFCVPTCFHVRIPKPCLCLSVRLSVRTPRKEIIIASSISVLH